ncbi:hypothetical protein RDMS_01380 [Deinococcus sp. RL]|uniref:DUF397 domain-containing protein n=1 Tax=Deinococcus sp. RL TaxID=1489678 RepID=UPI0004D75D75|nr:DUF397 domain-containing protein [Deinococcus sp. RL]KEF35555.1 hypothetical protein RDMS_01380 [Deinococcus sp. RL]
MNDPTAPVLTLTPDEWEAFLARLYERDDRLDLRAPGETYSPEEAVDAYVLSGHAEALCSAEVDGDLWGTLEDLEETAETEEEAWAKIVAFYLDRGCVLVRVAGTEEPEEWLLAEGLARRLGLVPSAAG